MLHHVDTIRWEIERRRNVRSGLRVLHPLLFCLASDTDLQAARITHATAQHMMVRDRIERDHAARSYRWQWTLLPECLDDFIDESNPVRVIDVFVDALDPIEMRFEGVEPAGTGRPSDHPSVLLKLDIYGYLNRVQSRRRLGREAGRNVEVMWPLVRLAPDHKTIADFRKDNGLALRKVCARFVELCREMGPLATASVAIDGSKFKAVNNRDKNFTKAEVQRWRAQLGGAAHFRR